VSPTPQANGKFGPGVSARQRIFFASVLAPRISFAYSRRSDRSPVVSTAPPRKKCHAPSCSAIATRIRSVIPELEVVMDAARR
jgi:hypothetical protein